MVDIVEKQLRKDVKTKQSMIDFGDNTIRSLKKETDRKIKGMKSLMGDYKRDFKVAKDVLKQYLKEKK